jgi:hypothetical protein
MEEFEARWLALGRREAELRPSVNADAGLTARPYPPRDGAASGDKV